MNLKQFINRPSIASPWIEGDHIPWNDPEFSARMLKEHLSQEHDAASRRVVIINQHVNWIHNELLKKEPTNILDLACGPGLYANRLASLGHTCTGIDFSPASIEYAIHTALEEGLNTTFIENDIRKTEYGTQKYGLVMLIFGEFNIFKPIEARQILIKAYQALGPGGILLLEPHTFDAVNKQGQQPSTWSTQQSGLFSNRPYIYLEEHFWDSNTCTATTRYIVADAITEDYHWHASTMQAYTDTEYGWLLNDCGFRNVNIHPSLGNIEAGNGYGLIAITGQKE